MSHTPHNKLKNYCDKLIKMYSGLGARTTQNMAVGATYLEIYIYIYIYIYTQNNNTDNNIYYDHMKSSFCEARSHNFRLRFYRL